MLSPNYGLKESLRLRSSYQLIRTTLLDMLTGVKFFQRYARTDFLLDSHQAPAQHTLESSDEQGENGKIYSPDEPAMEP